MPRGNGGIIGPVNTSFSGVWSLTEAQLRRSGGTWPSVYQQAINELSTGSDAVVYGSAADPYFEYTTLLLPGNGTNLKNNNEFLDSSTNAFPITRNPATGPNAPTQGTFSPFSQTGWGNYFDGTGDYLSVPANAAFQLGTGDFSIEAWIYPTTTPGGQYPVVIRLESGGYNSNGLTLFWRRYNVNPNGVSVDCGGVVSLAGTSTVALNTWTHVAVTRTGTTFALFVNGTREATTTSSNNFSVNDSVYIGDGTSDTEFPGYISNVRIVKGSNVYGVGTTLTVPTAPLTAISGTSLLTCQSNRFIDNSGNNFTVTPAGNASVQAFSPFNPTASWSASTNGGSGYFDGNGDYLSLSTPVVAATGDFTIEGWFYLTNAIGTRQEIIYQSSPTDRSAQGRLIIAIPNTGYLSTFVGGTNAPGDILSSEVIKPNTWYHFAYTRNSNTFTQYLNGVIQGTASGTISINQNPLLIGGFPPALSSTYWFGYLSNIRIVNGTAVYTSNFTPPTAPLTAITNTSLLLNFTNAGIYDATSKNDLETVGAASIVAPTPTKWGGGSITFNGSTAYLYGPTSRMLVLGSGDFTVEGWFYFNSVASGVLLDWRSDGAGFDFYLSTGTLNLSTSGTYYGGTSGITLVTGQWYHIALTRSGTAWRIYVNGTSYANITNSTNFTATILRVGYGTGATYFNGYLQDLRLTPGYARYTGASYTVPTAAFPTQ